ncbi:MAG: methyltransferase [Candidatus Hydrogenedentota bacterium]
MTLTFNGAAPVREDWFEHAFGELYPIVYAHRTVEAAAPEVQFATSALRLTERDRILDLCCGCGRHLLHLVGVTRHVVGLDYSDQLLWMASGILPPGTPLVRADMRAVPFSESFDVVTNFFTSFGYFFTDDENLDVARGVAQALRPGGRFFIDYLNPSHVKDSLVAQSMRDIDGYRIEEYRWIDDVTRRINKTTRVFRESALLNEFHESVQLYDRDGFVGLLNLGGLRVDSLYGDYSGAPYTVASPRMIAVGVRP